MNDILNLSTLKTFKVENYWSVPNQYIIKYMNLEIFQSYNSIICVIDHDTNKTYLGKDWAYSCTTWKYRNKFLNESLKETRRKIKEWKYILLDI
jgi:hypothetical protein